MNATPEIIYQTAYKALGTPMTLDETVPKDVRCAEAVSAVLSRAGVSGIPAHGIPGTAAFYDWMENSPRWTKIPAPEPGAVVICPSGMSSKGSPHGHMGICGKSWMMANDSDTGLFAAKYTYASWLRYFGTGLGFPTFYFRYTPAADLGTAAAAEQIVANYQAAKAHIEAVPAPER